MYAVATGNAKFIKNLKQYIGVQDGAGFSALMLAVLNDNLSACEQLAAEQKELKLQSKIGCNGLARGFTALILAARLKKNMEMIKLFIPDELGLQTESGQRASDFCTDEALQVETQADLLVSMNASDHQGPISY